MKTTSVSNASTPTPAAPVPNPVNPLRPPKRISSAEAVDAICGVVRDRLMRQDAFRRTNNSFLGVNLRYAVKVDLYALAESGVEFTGEATMGETPKGGRKITIEDSGHLVAGRVPDRAAAKVEVEEIRQSVSEIAGG